MKHQYPAQTEPGDLVHVHVVEPVDEGYLGSCFVTYRGERHSCKFDDEENLESVVGDSYLLHGALVAWDGPAYFTEPAAQLAERSGGWWAPPA